MPTKEPAKDARKRISKLPLILAVLTLAAFLVIVFVAAKIIAAANLPDPNPSHETFALDSSYYDTGKYSAAIRPAELAELIDAKKSFALYVSLPACTGETAKFRDIVNEYQINNHVTFNYMTSDSVKETSVRDTVTYFPSVILYKDGEIVTFLRFDSDADLPYYQSYDGFAKWFESWTKSS